MPPGNFVHRPAGAHPVRPRVRPPEPVARLVPFVETRAARRRQASGRAVGRRPRNLSTVRRPRVLDCIAGNNGPVRRVGAKGGVAGGVVSTSARTQRTVPYPGRPSPRLDTPRFGGEPVTRLRRTARRRAHGSSA
jgi:hypothetical protein